MYQEDDFSYEDQELLEIMAAYRREQLLNHLVGPAVSLVLHVVLFFVMILYLVMPSRELKPPVEATHIVEVPPQDIPPRPIDELIDIEIDELENISSTPNPVPVPNEEANESNEEEISEEEAQVDSELPEEVMNLEIPFQSVHKMPMPGNRTDEGKKKANKEFAVDKLTINSALKALLWLKRTQNSDGTWGELKRGNQDFRMNFTSLATLLFLAHGETPQSKNFGKTVLKALRTLSRHEFSEKHKSSISHYREALVTYAVSEGYALTEAPSLKEAMDRGVRVCLARQQRDGGFKDYRGGSTYEPDVSASGWYIQALKAASMAGCTVPGLEQARKRAKVFLMRSSFQEKGRVISFYYDYNK